LRTIRLARMFFHVRNRLNSSLKPGRSC
jgi:hypothetical protein